MIREEDAIKRYGTGPHPMRQGFDRELAALTAEWTLSQRPRPSLLDRLAHALRGLRWR